MKRCTRLLLNGILEIIECFVYGRKSHRRR